MEKGTRIKHRKRGFLATIDEVWNLGDNKPIMVRIFRDDSPKIPRWFVFQWPNQKELFDYIDKALIDENHFVYYMVSSVVKLDVEAEGWDVGCDETIGLHNICSAPGYDGVCNEDETGTRLVNYIRIDKTEFDRLKYDMFTEEGGI